MIKEVSLPVVVIGAGPVGLAAAAHLALRKLPFLVLEAGGQVGAHLMTYKHVKLFSPWRYNIDSAAKTILNAEGWLAPDDEALPTAGDVALGYLEPLSKTGPFNGRVLLNMRVKAVARSGFDKVKTSGRNEAPFVVQVEGPSGLNEIRCSAVIDATGTWGQPNPLGTHGLFVPGETEAASQIRYGMPDIADEERSRYAGRHVVVVGAGHSAAGNLIALAGLADQHPEMQIDWIVRGRDVSRVFGGGANDGLPARGELGIKLRRLVENKQLKLHLGFGIARIEQANNKLTLVAVSGEEVKDVDEIVSSTGSRPDVTIARELRVRLDHWLESTDELAPLIDPNEHSCGTVRPHGHRELAHPEANFYAIGAKSYGRAPNFLMATGYEQARSVVAALAGDMAAADEVQLDLPETGVCTVDLRAAQSSGGCCDAAIPAAASTCCDATPNTPTTDNETKCGCGPAPVTSPNTATSCCG